MNEKLIERPKKFDKRAYNDSYQKEHYISIAARVKPEVAERVNDYCKNNKMSKAEFIALAIDTLDK